MADVAGSAGRLLMIAGVVLFLVGALLASGVRIPLGRLPGDIVVERPRGAFYFPIVTCLLLSLLLSFIAWLFRR
jgi:hypothetical protein